MTDAKTAPSTGYPAAAIVMGLQSGRVADLLRDHNKLFAPLLALKGIILGTRHHHKTDIFTHSLLALEEARKLLCPPLEFLKCDRSRKWIASYLDQKADPVSSFTHRDLILFATLLHDIGMGLTVTVDGEERPVLHRDENGVGRCLQHERHGARAAERLALDAGFSPEEIRYVGHLIRYHTYGYELSGRESHEELRKFYKKIRFDPGVMLLRLADIRALDDSPTYRFEIDLGLLEGLYQVPSITPARSRSFVDDLRRLIEKGCTLYVGLAGDVEALRQILRKDFRGVNRAIRERAETLLTESQGKLDDIEAKLGEIRSGHLREAGARSICNRIESEFLNLTRHIEHLTSALQAAEQNLTAAHDMSARGLEQRINRILNRVKLVTPDECKAFVEAYSYANLDSENPVIFELADVIGSPSHFLAAAGSERVLDLGFLNYDDNAWLDKSRKRLEPTSRSRLIGTLSDARSKPGMEDKSTGRNRILFYRVNEPYGEFSNFSPHLIELRGKVWPTSEHYYQAQKFVGTEYEEVVRLSKSPLVAACRGRGVKCPVRADWEAVRDDIMMEALRAKFAQHPALRSLLIETGDAELVEHTSNDPYWADGGDGTGKNRLGQLLMELRAELRLGQFDHVETQLKTKSQSNRPDAP